MRELEKFIKKLLPLLLPFVFGVVLTTSFFVLYSRFSKQEQVSSQSPASTLTPTVDNPSFVIFRMRPEGWESFGVVKPTIINEEQVDTYYIPPNQNLVVPSLMSDYSFVAIRNNIGSEYLFPKDYYGVVGSFENGVLSGKFHEDGKGGIWLQASFVEKEEPYLSARLIAHGKNKEAVESLIEEMGTMGISEQYLSAELEEIPPRRIFTPNAVDPSGKYRFYLPPGYVLQSKKLGWDWAVWKKPSGEKICLALVGVHKDPCSFSCANTGCELLDLVLYLKRDGSLEVSELLQKAQGEGGMGPRFAYDADHPWINYSASFSADNNNLAEGVLELLYLAESIERTY